MRNAIKVVLLFFSIIVSVGCFLVLRSHAIPVLYPSGVVALQERGLLINAVLLMLIIIIPVIVFTIFVAWRYRASAHNPDYVPNFEQSVMDELIWWSIPIEIVLVLGALTWSSTHALDPRQPLVSTEAPLDIQVIALEAQWLFIYPDQGIATTNFLEIPTDRPVHFLVTADAPMNSFWIPALAGQIYAMTGMVNTLNVMTHATGTFSGSSANYSGEGFSRMSFDVRAVPKNQFEMWIQNARAGHDRLSDVSYSDLHGTALDTSARSYASVQSGIFDRIIMKFMSPATHLPASASESTTSTSSLNVNSMQP